MIVVVGDYDVLLHIAVVCAVTPPNLEGGGGARVLLQQNKKASYDDTRWSGSVCDDATTYDVARCVTRMWCVTSFQQIVLNGERICQQIVLNGKKACTGMQAELKLIVESFFGEDDGDEWRTV